MTISTRSSRVIKCLDYCLAATACETTNTQPWLFDVTGDAIDV